MKKFMALTLTGLFVIGGFGTVSAAAADPAENRSGSRAETASVQQNNLYLVPGTYVSGGVKAENVISSGAQKLTQEECD